MEQLGRRVVNLLLRLVLLVLGLVFLVSLFIVTAAILVLWGLRALWAKLTGQPVQRPVFTIIRRAQWQRFYRPGAARASEEAEVIDVESRQIDSGRGPER